MIRAGQMKNIRGDIFQTFFFFFTSPSFDRKLNESCAQSACVN